jgi:cytidine deaminase
VALRAAAVDVAGRAYAPYSRLRVGAAGLTTDGRTVTGCNVENASFGVTLCAECGLVSALHSTAPHSTASATASATATATASATATATAPPPGAQATPALIAVAVVAGDGDPLLPCGRCRQLLLEAGGPALLVDTAAGQVPLSELLPAAFGAPDLAARSDRHADPHADRHSDPHADRDADPHADPHADRHADRDADPHADAGGS